MKYRSNAIKISYTFIGAIALLFMAFFIKLGYVAMSSTVEGTDLKKLAESRSTATKKLIAERGRIYDKDGELLAQNVNSYTVIAYLSPSRTTNDKYPKHVVDLDKTATELSSVLLPLNEKMTKEYIYKLLDQKLYQVELGPGGRGITENTKREIEALGLPGIDFIKSSKRYYQNGDFASYIIGYAKKYTNDDGQEEMRGEMGIEGYCNRYLKGKDGTITYQKDAYGYQMANRISYTEPESDGYDVYLTIDKKVQMFLDNAVNDFNNYSPEWVTATIADAKTGAIIGSSTSPSFDPNTLNITNYNNPLISYTYEPGSTMKIFSFASAIEEGKYNGEDTYMSGTIDVADYKIKDWNKTGWGRITFDIGFTYSSNVAAVNLARNIGKKQLLNYYDSLGFGDLTNIELYGELKGDVSFDYEVEVASASYGQGITVTPIQMVQALTTLTNDGTLLQPYIIDKIVDPNTNQIVYQGKKREKNKVFSTATVNKVIELMDKTVNTDDTQATGKVYHTDAVRLVGKTGTANYTGKNGEYITGTYTNIRSFAGVFPKDNPEYIVYVAVKDFNGTGKNMGNIVKNLVESISKYRNLDERPSDKDESKIVTVKNYINVSTLTALQSINNVGSTPIVIGDGDIVINQYPKKGTRVSQSSKIYLVTNGSSITMPDMTGWSSSEVKRFESLSGVKVEMNGYGYVSSTNIEKDAIINKEEDVIVVNLVPKEIDIITTTESTTNEV